MITSESQYRITPLADALNLSVNEVFTLKRE